MMNIKNTSSSNKRNMELVVLAILAAFFVSLGNNMGRIFN